MKWFKHLSGSLKDPFISDLIHEFGGDGYLVFFGVLELMADEFDVNNPGKATFSMHYLTRNLQLSRQKTVRILAFFQNYSIKNCHISCEIVDNTIQFNCPRLKELTDTFTHNKLISNIEANSKQLIAPREEVEVDTDKEEEKKKHCASVPDRTARFDGFWSVWPGKKVEKKKCLEYWKSHHLEERADEIAAGLKREIEWRKNAKPGTFIPEWKHPITWLRGECWNDEYATENHPQPGTSPVPAAPTPVNTATYERLVAYTDSLRNANRKMTAWFAWEVKRPIRRDINAASYRTWIEPILLVSITKRRAVLFVPGAHTASWITEHYLAQIETHIRAVPGFERCEVTITAEIPVVTDA